MKIAIHHRPGSYSDLWIEYCQKHDIQYRIVDAYANDILEQIADCDAFMWHFHLHQYKDYLFAKQLIYVIEKQMGKITFPNYDTCWHYDDKVGQKYLFESIGAPLIPSYIFYTRQEALEWAKTATFPKVFKLRCGASSSTVQLINSRLQAKSIIKKAFNGGIKTFNYIELIKERYHKYRNGLVSLRNLLGLIKMWTLRTKPLEYYNYHSKEIGYVYFQDFIPDNDFDIRVLIIGNRAIAKKRMNRENDFRASGSHINIFDEKKVDLKYIKKAFEINDKLKMQSVAFDFLHDSNANPLLTEVSYCSGIKNYKYYSGYWTADLQWHECKITDFCNFIVEDVIKEIQNQ